jgi:hypothetical protein
MATIGTICWAFIGPILADGITSPDAGPTWTLAGACAIFLSALAWAVRSLVVWGKDGAAIFYGEIVKPLAAAQRELMETLRDTREQDSVALKSLAADVHQLNQNIRCRHNEP